MADFTPELLEKMIRESDENFKMTGLIFGTPPAADAPRVEPELSDDDQQNAVLAAALWKSDNMTSPSDGQWNDACNHAKVVRHWLAVYDYDVFKVDDQPSWQSLLPRTVELPLPFVWGLIAGLSVSVLTILGSVVAVVMKWNAG